jgi:hypothetical protein
MENSFLKDKLNVFLLENHPDLMMEFGDQLDQYISDRVETALQVYKSQTQAGIHQDVVLENTYIALKEGLIFSKFNILESILEEYYYQIYEERLKDKSLVSYIISLIEPCESIFSKYNTSDNYTYSDLLITELIGNLEEIINH